MSDSSSEVGVTYTHSSIIPRIHINRLDMGDDCILLAVFQNARIINGLTKLWEVVVLVSYKNLNMSRTI